LNVDKIETDCKEDII